jgi:hypothetical protein
MLCTVYSRSLVAAALAYALLHHIGLLPDGLGAGPDGTRLLDWLDLAVPWAVLGTAAAVLWDEPVGHHIWFAGVALVLAALALTMIGKPRPPVLGYVLALTVGLTWASNAVGGGTEIFSLLVALAATAFGWRHRHDLAGVLVVGFGPAAVVVGVALSGVIT